MIDPVTFFKGLGIAIGIVLVFSGLIFWIGYLLIKYKSTIRYLLKYKLFRAKYDEEDVKLIMDIISSEDAPESLEGYLLLTNKYPKQYVNELLYIQKQMIKSAKRGVKKNE